MGAVVREPSREVGTSGSKPRTTVRGLLTSRETAFRSAWNTVRPLGYAAVVAGGLWFGVALVADGGLHALPLWLMSFLAALFAAVAMYREFDRHRRLKAWLGETDVRSAIAGAEDARKLALLAPPWHQAAYNARKAELRQLPLPKETLRALHARPSACKEDGTTFTGCCGPR